MELDAGATAERTLAKGAKEPSTEAVEAKASQHPYSSRLEELQCANGQYALMLTKRYGHLVIVDQH
jgi:hypothetical protein